MNKNKKQYFAGTDKIDIELFKESERKKTIINIKNIGEIEKDDLLYFYNTLPLKEQVVFLEDDIYISKIKRDKDKNILEVFVSYKDDKNKVIHVNMNEVVGHKLDNRYIVFYNKKLDTTHYFKIVDINDTFITINNINYVPLFDIKDIRIGFADNNLRGVNDSDVNSIFNSSGYRVLNIDSNNIEIDFLFEDLPSYLRKNKEYNNKSIFLVQDKMQIEYNFTIEYKEL
jgi:hypothetical protein